MLLGNFVDGLFASSWPIPNLSRRWLRGLEGEALWDFGRSFGTVPICNLDIPVSAVSDFCEGRARVLSCPGLEHPLTLEQLAKRLNRVLAISESSPIGNPSEVVISFGFVRDKSGNLTFGQTDRYKSARLLTSEEAEHSRKAEESWSEDNLDEAEETRAFVGQQNLAAWSIEKMKAVIELCEPLSARKTKAKTVRPFNAPCREAPVPHTWGEVALIQARIVSDSWQPNRNVWVKVMFGKELLGQGKLQNGWYYGEDISSLPQTMQKRPICTAFDGDDRSIINGDADIITEYEEGLEVTRTNPKKLEQLVAELEQEQQERYLKLQAKVDSIFAEAMNQVESGRK